MCVILSFSIEVEDYVLPRLYVEDQNTQENFSSSPKGHLDGSDLPVHLNGYHQTGSSMVNQDNQEVIDVDSLGPLTNTETVETSEVNEDPGTSPSNDEVDDEFWLPPQPEDEEDDKVGRVSIYDEDDDDEFGDGTTWAEPSSLSSFGEEGNGIYKFKEEKLKAMNDVKNGKFTTLVSQLIKSVSVDSSRNYVENWVDIVISLSWEAASFVKPDSQEGKAMDPDGYVKVKCIATGSRTESQVIKGLVFKKHAAHKHMPTKYKNPRLLLINGSLDLSSGGLSSFGSMQQEKDNLKSSTVDMIEMYHPNVILVEKSVSRDIQESILAKGMTLVFDMKLHRLERVSSCIGTPILSSEVAIGQKLKKCDSFYIQKFVEEHVVSTEGGKKPSKTLMFLEGAPTHLGCTILLMGANSEELKRIKCVVRCAVVMAYHLILETSFLLDQSSMFSTISSSEVVSIALTTTQSIDEEKSDAETNLISSSEENSSLSFDPYNAESFPGLSLSTSIQNFMNDSFPLFSSQSMPTSLGEEGGIDHDSPAENGVQIFGAPETLDQIDDKQKVSSDEENSLNNEGPNLQESSDIRDHGDNDEEQKKHIKDEISTVLNSESILVLMSSRNASRGTICEQRHFSQIKFYRSFDVPLGKFLRDNLLSQRLHCKTCSEPPEEHLFFYAHHNKQLTIQVKRLPGDKILPGETEGKLWMWSRCGQCKLNDGKSTKRVLISTAARGLSFGKFLELSFSNHSSFNCPSSCGHSFQKDFLYFFGLGPMVAMFKYSSVATYSVSLPPQKMEFNSSIRGDFLKKDSENVYLKGISMFLEIEKSLKEIGTRYVGMTLNILGLSKDFSDIVEMLKKEKEQFEVDIQNAIKNGSEDNAVCKLLRLNRVRLELLLESCVWDRRLHALLSSDLKVINTDQMNLQAQEHHIQEQDQTAEEESSANDIALENGDYAVESTSESQINEIPIDGQVEGLNENGPTVHHLMVKPTSEDKPDAAEDFDSSGESQTIKTIENNKDWMWAPFTDIRCEYMEDLQSGYLPKFESLNSYAAESLAQKLFADESSRLHIPLGTNDYIVSDYEDEYSSIIACALTLLKDIATSTEDLVEEAKREKSIESSQKLTRIFSFGSLDTDGGVHSPPSNPTENSHSSSFDGIDLLDSLLSYGASHPEVSMGLGKYPGKRKYSIVCIYASKFRQLRERCCPSEIDYIASLGRCMNWDAKGGKSKSFFAKTLDDRFIIKEIKRIEFESFMKFAPNYFEYMNQCYELGNQTCLAKILGIYQVVTRTTKNGKETRHDLLVMENLSFGRHIAKQYDLKGALHARLSTAGNGSGDVLLDQNFVNDMNISPLYVSRKPKQYLQRAVYNDTNFLNSINVMDYSLLVGVDTQRRELVCGIIDYLRQYTWDKQLENWVKSSLVVPKNQLPTIVSPKEYKKRFRKFIDTHFLSVPDHWCSQRSSNPCKLCGPAEGNGSSHTKSQNGSKYESCSL
ncbi:hypothetical protein RD792_011060 [Penstemon davidsonii]|uniref:1-phosphatidylinositol-3-phosphate 5-kinase n=1 Tax=Penstemon davidsonii TaxID=160366 RepID=A0ABR0D4Z9_9LAMI|nr:hypothetical protein RD792_011060 [Penstemon davidsonii]